MRKIAVYGKRKACLFAQRLRFINFFRRHFVEFKLLKFASSPFVLRRSAFIHEPCAARSGRSNCYVAIDAVNVIKTTDYREMFNRRNVNSRCLKEMLEIETFAAGLVSMILKHCNDPQGKEH